MYHIKIPQIVFKASVLPLFKHVCIALLVTLSVNFASPCYIYSFS